VRRESFSDPGKIREKDGHQSLAPLLSIHISILANHLLLVTAAMTTTACPFFTAAADFLLDAWMLADDVCIALYMYHQEFHFVVEEQRFKKQALQWISSLLDSVVSIRIPSRKLFRHVNNGITRLC
jgi:hypothetical protein